MQLTNSKRAWLSRIAAWAQKLPHPGSGAWEYGVLCSAVLTSRFVIYALGVRFNLVLDWMFLADPKHLRQHLLETTYYFHAFPPGMNILTGVLLKLASDNVAVVAHCLFVMCGLLMACSLLYLSRAVGVPRWWAVAFTFVFSVLPVTLYFENLYLYDYPVPALLTFSAALFHRALLRRGTFWWVTFFWSLTILALLRSALHLLWFGALLSFVFIVVKTGRRRIALAAVGPAAVLLLLYAKNLWVFGVFDSQSQSGGNAILITTYHMPRDLRTEWINTGRLSPFAGMGFAAPPREFVTYLGNPNSDRWARPELSDLERPSHGGPNYNHWFFLEVNRRRRGDAVYYLSQRPFEYLHTVLSKSLPQTFGPSTLWHPRKNTPRCPHYQHRQILGGYEAAFNCLVHETLLPPVGLYLLLPFFIAWIAWRAWRLQHSASDTERASSALWYFCLLQIGYLVPTIALLTWGENARYRYIIEPFIWLIVTRTLVDVGIAVRRGITRWRQRELAHEPHASLSTRAHP